MTDTRAMLDASPAGPPAGAAEIAAAIDACLNCLQTCTSCNDADLAEKDVAELSTCVALCTTCADVCHVTARVLSRSAHWDNFVVHRVLQAYLEADGRALVRQWQSADNRYSAPARTRWSLSDDKLCIELSAAPICAKVHIWGPRIAGIGTRPYAMLDGDLQPGNAIAGGR